MIRLSRLADYAVLLMAVAARSDRAWLSAQHLSHATKLPLATVSKVLKKLQKAKLLVSSQGTKGGYKLSRSAYAISVTDIIAAMDGPMGITLCSISDGDCALEQLCSIRTGFKRINNIIHQELTKVTLAELAAPAHHAAANIITQEHVL